MTRGFSRRWRRAATIAQKERRSFLVLAILSLGGIGYADYLVQDVPLGLLYLLPITLVSMTGRLGHALLVTLVCLVLREWWGPFESSAGPLLLRSLFAGIGYFFVAWLTARRSRERFRLQARQESQREQLAGDLELAAEAQRLLLPEVAPELAGYQLAARFFPAKIVGGDYYDFFTRGPDGLGVAIGDVSGKGVVAGMLVPALGTALRMGLEEGRKPARLLSKIDRVLYGGTNLARYATLVYAEIDGTRKELTYCNAGHPPPLLLRRHDASTAWLEKGGPPLGLLPSASFVAEKIRLIAGDILLMYTDGLSDAEDRSGTPLGRDCLPAWIQRHADLDADALVQALKSELDAYTDGRRLADDCTILLVKVL